MAEVAVRRPFEVPGTAWLASTPALARFVFRGDATARAAASAAFGVELPAQACRGLSSGGRAALWLGPDEWLLLGPDAERSAVASTITGALGLLPHSMVDVTHRQVGLLVRGPRVEWLLEAQCPLPLNPRDFPVGMCSRTLYGKTEVVLWRTGPDVFHVEVWRSFAAYLAGVLGEVAREPDR